MEHIANQIYEYFGQQGYDVALSEDVITVLDSESGNAWNITVQVSPAQSINNLNKERIMETYNFFIGWNNQTKKLEVDKIESILDHHHEGYTIYFAQGYWKGQKEKSCVVVVTDTKANILRTLKELKRTLKQDAIGYQIAPILEFYS